MPKNFVDYVLDFETSGKRGWHGIRQKFNPPSITQVGLIRIDPAKSIPKAVIGGGPGHGWTSEIGPLVDKYNPLSADKLPSSFWRELKAYDPSVTRQGSILHEQVKRHVQAYIDAKAAGNVGSFKSAADYIRQMQSAIQRDINAGLGVRLHAYNMGFDITEAIHEMNRASAKEGQAFMNWLDDHVKSGAVKLKGVEENIHRAMFDVMMKDREAMPKFASSRYFEAARQAGLKTVGIEAASPHVGLRELITDLSKIQSGQSAKHVLQGLPAEVRAQLSSISSYDDFINFTKALDADVELKRLLFGHYQRKITGKYGTRMAKHVQHMGFEYVSGWRQELISQLLKHPKVHHKALEDTMSSWKIMQATSNPADAQKIARTVLTDADYIGAEMGAKYGKFLEESALAVQQKGTDGLHRLAHKMSKTPPAGLSRLARSPITLPIIATAGGLLLANQLMQNATPQSPVESIKKEMEGRIEGLRRAYSQWDEFSGINASRQPFANVSDFGSGRWDAVWDGGSYKGVPMSPDVYNQRMYLNMRPELAFEEQMSKAKASVPRAYGPSREELANQQIDLSDYIYELKDADTILLRKAWLSSDVPVLGPAVGWLQKHLMNLARTFTGDDMGFEIRVAGMDAPETYHGDAGNFLPEQRYAQEATRAMEGLMRGNMMAQVMGGRATHIRLKPGQTFGRYVGQPMAGSTDIAGELVRRGGAIALDYGAQQSPYRAAEAFASGTGAGMWQYPEYQGVLEAKRRGLDPMFSHVQKRTHIGRSLQTAATYSLMTYAQNPQLHGVRDQYAQNLYVRGY
jgi:endonuclease YncB( thermonuclease family)